jgi:hypothetical protein
VRSVSKNLGMSPLLYIYMYFNVYRIGGWGAQASANVCVCALRRKSNAGEGFFEVKRQPKDSTRTPTSKSSPFAAPNLAPMRIINETPQARAHDDDHVGLWQGGRWSVTPQQRPHTSTGVEFDDSGLWQVRV